MNVFAIAFGADADWNLTHGLATDGDGVALRVPESTGAEVDIRRFMRSLTTPVLKDVRVEYPAHVKASRVGADVLFAGSELLIVGTYDAAQGPILGRVLAQSPDGERSWAFESKESSGLSFLPRVVAYQEIRRLQDLAIAEGERAEWTQEITRLALLHGFVTDHTSLVVTLDAREQPVSQCDCAILTDAQSSGFDASSGSTRRSSTALPTTTTPTLGPRLIDALGSRSHDAAPEPRPGGAQTTTPSAEVPGPAPGLVVLAATIAAVAMARRRT